MCFDQVHNELAALISHRNRLAAHMVPSRDDAGAPAAPTMLIDNHACEKCPAVETCAIYHKSVERGNYNTSGLPPARFLALTQHLSAAHCAFLEHWYPLIGMEEEASKGQRPQVWALSGKQREALGTCLPGLKFKAYTGVQSFPDGPKHCYVFTSHAVRGRADKDNSGNSDLLGHMSKRDGSFEDLCMGSLEQGGTSLLSSSFSVGDMALLSVEGRHPVLARVSVTEVTQDYLKVTSKRAIQLSTLSELSTAQIIKGPTSTHSAQSTLGNVKGMQGSITPPLIPCHSNELPVSLPNLDQGILTAAEDQRQSLHDMTNLPVPVDTAASTTGLRHHTPGAREGLSALSWRLDRDESSSTFNLMRSNLLSLLAPPGTVKGSIASRLRQLIIDCHPPQQYNRTPGTSEGSTESLDDQAALCGSSLNPEQQEAVSKVLQMRDYALVLGMPGTGKTSTIVSMIRALLSAGRTILVTSYTNSAVDNILLKLIEEQTKQEANHERGHANVDMSFLRIGNCQAVHPSVRPYLLGGTRNPITSASDVQHIATHSRIVATTCLSCRHALLSQRTFDVVIVDEASQISVPAIVGPLCLARSFVLIGDHYQLSPLVTNKRAQEAGLGTSLFRMLCQAAPQAVTTLRNQYRMADDIMYLSNHLVYNGAMICGSDSVAAAQLVLPKYMAMKQSAMLQSEWLLKALDPEQRVIFLDTSKVPGTSEQQLGDGVSNQGEVMLISALLHHLLLAGLPPSDVGVISPYKAQVAALLQESRKVVSRWQQNMPRSIYRSGAAAAISTKEGFQEERMPEFSIGAASAPGSDLDLHHDGPTASSSTVNLLLPCRAVEDAVEVLTVDRYQGRDKPCIIISLVRSNSSGKAGRLLADWQRINVAITRAKHKLVFVGCADSLKELPMMSALVDALSNRGWCLQLPPSCLQGLDVRA
ncbi:hypothetical protein CEUSTIGMA_g1304.t1 [Chlamydomonas eustigma]|uniref:DNA replication ATP-dependent helicase/nuclease n=1 Tax=Chlamydomonas eustigma TaxID=1157962 RepID=A0A250WSP5_9CHLO|nr:hypothetical protein CEUSTIGMA_g1304.t1 [Chlamydomonas eustigma]|eukprot:GAX73854.1 hypothetical protein CEUSTIGMA_g1304.t1 [Chlamydomonas eustigma]